MHLTAEVTTRNLACLPHRKDGDKHQSIERWIPLPPSLSDLDRSTTPSGVAATEEETK